MSKVKYKFRKVSGDAAIAVSSWPVRGEIDLALMEKDESDGVIRQFAWIIIDIETAKWLVERIQNNIKQASIPQERI